MRVTSVLKVRALILQRMCIAVCCVVLAKGVYEVVLKCAHLNAESVQLRFGYRCVLS